MAPDALPLAGRVAVVAGASRGLGRAVATRFAAEGAALMLSARGGADLAAVADELSRDGARVDLRAGDVSDWAFARDLVRDTIAELGPPDVLVSTVATLTPIGPFADVDPSEWHASVRGNLFGPMNLCRAVLPSMIERRSGKIILFAGGGAASPFPRFSAYGASKAALVRLTETVADEVAELGIQVNAVAPGFVDTALQDAVLEAGPLAGTQYERVRRARESGEGAAPAELAAELAVFLASPASGSLTGKLVSAPHDPWREWAGRSDELNATPLYTLRRLDPHTLGTLERGGR